MSPWPGSDAPAFQEEIVGHLQARVANAVFGIVDRNGVFHICPNPA